MNRCIVVNASTLAAYAQVIIYLTLILVDTRGRSQPISGTSGTFLKLRGLLLQIKLKKVTF